MAKNQNRQNDQLICCNPFNDRIIPNTLIQQFQKKRNWIATGSADVTAGITFWRWQHPSGISMTKIIGLV
jgi:hypothetical protein